MGDCCAAIAFDQMPSGLRMRGTVPHSCDLRKVVVILTAVSCALTSMYTQVRRMLQTFPFLDISPWLAENMLVFCMNGGKP